MHHVLVVSCLFWSGHFDLTLNNWRDMESWISREMSQFPVGQMMWYYNSMWSQIVLRSDVDVDEFQSDMMAICFSRLFLCGSRKNVYFFQMQNLNKLSFFRAYLRLSRDLGLPSSWFTLPGQYFFKHLESSTWIARDTPKGALAHCLMIVFVDVLWSNVYFFYKFV